MPNLEIEPERELSVFRRLEVCATFDHRVLDGAHAAAMARILRTWIEDPAAHFDPLPARLPRTA